MERATKKKLFDAHAREHPMDFTHLTNDQLDEAIDQHIFNFRAYQIATASHCTETSLEFWTENYWLVYEKVQRGMIPQELAPGVVKKA